MTTDDMIADWKRHGVPGVRGRIVGDEIVDAPVLIPPTDPLFWLAVSDRMEALAEEAEGEPVQNVGDEPIQNAFCATGPGGGVDPSCSPHAAELPSKPYFVSSNKELVAKNEKAVEELHAFASKGDLDSLHDHPGTPSPKVQEYKKALIKAVQDAAIAHKPPLEASHDDDYVKMAMDEIYPHHAECPGCPNPADVKFVKTLPGSTHPQLVEDKDGKQWVMKTGDAGHVRNEAETDAAYRAAGVPVPKSGIVEGVHGPVKISEFLHGETLAKWEEGKGYDEIKAMHKEIGKHMAADALLANWDVVGQNKDNIMIVDGKPVRVDNGGGLKYRAMGKEKGDKFTDDVKELKDLKDFDKNPQTAKVFVHVTDADLHQQMKDLIGKRKEILDAVKDPKSKAILSNRFDHIESLVKAAKPIASVPLSPGAAWKEYASTHPTSAAIPLHTGEGFAAHLAEHATTHGVKITQLYAAMVAKLNPNGLKPGETIVLPRPPGANYKEKQAKLAAFVGKIAPPGTAIKTPLSYAPAAKLGITKKYGEEGTFTTEKAVVGEKPVGIPEHLKQYLPHIHDDSTVTAGTASLPHPPSFDMASHMKWKAGLTAAEAAAISGWKGSSKAIRAAVEKSQKTGEPLTGSAKAFMSAVSKSPPHVGVVYRGIHGPYAEQIVQQIIDAGVGTHWSDDAPHNLSLNSATGVKFSGGKVLFRVVTKTGRPDQKSDGFGCDGWDYDCEKELIGMPKTKYQVVGIHKNVKFILPESSHYSGTTVNHVIDIVEV